MPTYNIRNTKTDETNEVFMSYNELQKHLKKNPHLEMMLSSPPIVSGVAGLLKPDEGFRDLLRRMKKNNPGSTINIT